MKIFKYYNYTVKLLASCANVSEGRIYKHYYFYSHGKIVEIVLLDDGAYEVREYDTMPNLPEPCKIATYYKYPDRIETIKTFEQIKNNVQSLDKSLNRTNVLNKYKDVVEIVTGKDFTEDSCFIVTDSYFLSLFDNDMSTEFCGLVILDESFKRTKIERDEFEKIFRKN